MSGTRKVPRARSTGCAFAPLRNAAILVGLRRLEIIDSAAATRRRAQYRRAREWRATFSFSWERIRRAAAGWRGSRDSAAPRCGNRTGADPICSKPTTASKHGAIRSAPRASGCSPDFFTHGNENPVSFSHSSYCTRRSRRPPMSITSNRRSHSKTRPSSKTRRRSRSISRAKCCACRSSLGRRMA